MQNRVRISLISEMGRHSATNFLEVLQKLNNRGLHATVDSENGQIRGLIITDKTTGLQLNRFNLTYPLNNLNWVKTLLASSDNLLTGQKIDLKKVGIFNNYEKTGVITSDQFLLLQNDPNYRSDLMRLFFRFQKQLSNGQSTKAIKKGALNTGINKKSSSNKNNNVRGESDNQYGVVYNNTIFNDLWDGKSKGI
jgi:hypothetical protein